MDCPKCGHKNKTGASACSSCYFDLNSTKKPITAPAQKPASPRKASPLPAPAQPPQQPSSQYEPQSGVQTQVQPPPQPGMAPGGPGYQPPAGPGSQLPGGPAPFQGPAAFSGMPYFNYAGFGTRLAATLVDGLIFLPVYFILVSVMGGGAKPIPGLSGEAGSFLSKMASASDASNILSLIQAIYAVAMVGTLGATVGRMALGIKVVREDGSPVGVGVALARYVVEMILCMVTCNLHFLAVAFSDTKQGWHDKLMKTIVIHSR